MNKFEYAFIKANRVIDIYTFDSENLELANQILLDRNFDEFVLITSEKPALYSLYENNQFIPPTQEYLISIGVITEYPVVNLN